MTVEMEDAFLVAAQEPLDAAAVAPGDGGQAGDVFQEIVVVRRRERDAQVAEGFEDGAVLGLQGADGLAEPAVEFTFFGAPSLRETFSAAERRSSMSPEWISSRARSAQAADWPRDWQRSTTSSRRPVQEAARALRVAPMERPAPTIARAWP
jgi:hypothetical protein